MKDTGEFGVKMNTVPKYVVSTTLQNPSWKKYADYKKNILEEIKKLKKQNGGNILVAGSGKLVEFLLENNLVDGFHILLHSLVLGEKNTCLLARRSLYLS